MMSHISTAGGTPSVDTTPPVISNCPSGVTVQAASGATSAVATWSIPSATDNSGLTPTRTSTHNPGQSFNTGSTQVTYTFTDGSGNSAVCSFTVTVIPAGIVPDTTPPVVSNCPGGVSVQAAAGATSAVATWSVPSATDNSGATPTSMSTHVPGDSFGIGQTTVIYTFTDPSGNSATCSFAVTVVASGRYSLSVKVGAKHLFDFTAHWY